MEIMDSFIMLLVCIFIVLIVSGSDAKKYQSKMKGSVGEKGVTYWLGFLPKKEYRVINNVFLQTERGISQIDHIVVSRYGIFVIETKNYKGWIYGNEYAHFWTQNIYGHTYQFINPIHQNYGHIKALEKILSSIGNVPLISLVAFSDNCTLKVQIEKNHVVYWSKIISTIKQYKNMCMSENQLTHMVHLIKQSNIDSQAIRKKHVQEIRQKGDKRNHLIKKGLCPRCGGQLVKRKGKYGPFLGCSHYPKCRYTMKYKR